MFAKLSKRRHLIVANFEFLIEKNEQIEKNQNRYELTNHRCLNAYYVNISTNYKTKKSNYNLFKRIH